MLYLGKDNRFAFGITLDLDYVNRIKVDVVFISSVEISVHICKCRGTGFYWIFKKCGDSQNPEACASKLCSLENLWINWKICWGVCIFKVSTWKKQYDAAAHTDIPAMNKLAEWLANNLPPDDNEETLIHGDFRIDNIIFHPTEVFEMYLYI